MNQTRSTVRRGQDFAVFPVHLPRWTDRESIVKPCVGKIRKLVSFFNEAQEFELAASFSLLHQGNIHSFSLKGSTAEEDAQRAAGVARRLQSHLDDAAAKFPSFQSHPHFHYDDGLPGGGAFVLDMPPRSSFFTTSSTFFSLLGFEDDDMDSTTRLVSTSASGRMMNAMVYGFFNRFQENVQFYSEPYTPTETLSERYKVVKEGMPTSFRLQVEFMNWNPFRLESDEPLREDPAAILLALDRLCQDATARFQLVANPLALTLAAAAVEGPPKLLLTCTGQQNARVTLVLKFEDESARALGLVDGQELSFALNATTTRTINTRSSLRRDPFAGLYPVTVLSVGSGLAQSWVEGLGFVPVMGIVEDEKKPVYSEGAVFETDLCSLHLEFYDYAIRKITFQNDFIFNLTMDFKQVKPPSEKPERKKARESLDNV